MERIRRNLFDVRGRSYVSIFSVFPAQNANLAFSVLFDICDLWMKTMNTMVYHKGLLMYMIHWLTFQASEKQYTIHYVRLLGMSIFTSLFQSITHKILNVTTHPFIFALYYGLVSSRDAKSQDGYHVFFLWLLSSKFFPEGSLLGYIFIFRIFFSFIIRRHTNRLKRFSY